MRKELIAIFFFFLVALSLISLLTYNPADPSMHNATAASQIHNWFGIIGAHLSGLLIGFFGLGAFWIPVLLTILGIRLIYRQVDFAVYQQRLEVFDFDMTTTGYAGSPSPGNELVDLFGSAAAMQDGSDNLWGVHEPAIDALIGAVLGARTDEALRAACHALDRVLVCGWYSVPHWYAAAHRVAWRAHRFGMPQRLPLYYEPQAWAAACWWREGEA